MCTIRLEGSKHSMDKNFCSSKWWFYEGPGPLEVFLAPSLPPPFLEKHKVLNFEYKVY